LPEAGKDTMDFGKTKSDAKAWRDIWGAGQGVGNIDDILPTREVVMRMEREYREALKQLGAT
jgi:nitronate monooxygenase